MKIFNKILNVFTVCCFIGMLVTVLLQIFFRYVLKTGVPWTEELSRLLFIYAGFFGTAMAAREKDFIIIDVLFKRTPPKVQMVLYVIAQVVTVLFYSCLFVGAVMMYGKVKGTYYQTMLWLSNGVTYAAVIGGAFLTVLYTVLNSIDKFRRKGE